MSDRTDPHRLAMVPKTLGVQALLLAMLPANLALTGTALVRSAVTPTPRATAERPRTILISGGKMTKALQLARSFHRAGHRVVLVETAKYRFTGHRFSNAVDRFHVVPPPQDPGYAQALLDIVRRENVDVYVPVCSPAASYYDALAKPLLEPYCEVLHCDAETIELLDDKHRFAAAAAELGLPVPDTHLVTDPEQVVQFEFDEAHAGPTSSEHRLRPRPPPRPDPAARGRRAGHGAVRAVEADLRGQPVDPAGVRPRSGVLHPRHGARRGTHRLLLLRVLGVPAQLHDGRQAGDRVLGAHLRPRAQAHRPGVLRLHGGRRRPALRDRVQPAHALGDHHVLRPPGPRGRLPRPGRPVGPAAGVQPADVLALPGAVAPRPAPGHRPRARGRRAARQGGRLRLDRPAAVPAGAPSADPVPAAAQPAAPEGLDPGGRQHRQARRTGGD